MTCCLLLLHNSSSVRPSNSYKYAYLGRVNSLDRVIRSRNVGW